MIWLLLLAAAIPERIVSTAPSFTEMLYAVGAGERVVAVSTYCHYPASVDRLPRIGTYLEPNVEAILRLRPDLGLVHAEHPQIVRLLRAAGIATLALRNTTLEETLRSATAIGQAVGRPREGSALETRLRQGLDVMRVLGVFLESNPRFGANIAPRFEGARALDPAVEPQWRAWRREFTARMRALLPPGTLLLLPTTPGIAPLRFLRDAHAERFYKAALTLCSVAGLAGLPVVTLPVAALDGCPLGLSVIAGPDEDEALLAYLCTAQPQLGG